jgi:hypothetical protein
MSKPIQKALEELSFNFPSEERSGAAILALSSSLSSSSSSGGNRSIERRLELRQLHESGLVKMSAPNPKPGTSSTAASSRAGGDCTANLGLS